VNQLFRAAAVLALLLPLTTRPAAPQAADSARVADLERRLEAISRELERLSLGRDVVQADTGQRGLGPAASKVYRVNQGVSIGGYGEILYQNFARTREDGAPATSRDRFDALRAIVYLGYKFNDRLLVNTEVEIEHANEIFLEFAYLDYLLHPRVGVRAGLLLAPLGLVNELHEPPIFLGAQRPVTETRIIPTTWRENGIGLFGDAGPFAWRAYLMNSLDGAGFGAGGLRGGRQKGAQALAEDLGVAARLDYTGTPGLTLGGSAYYGQTGQGRTLNGAEVDGDVVIWDLHADYRARGWELRGLVAGARLGDAVRLNQLNGLSGSAGVGSRMLGWYAQAGYDVLRHTRSAGQLVPFLRFEQVDTQRAVPAGFAANPANDLTVTTVGVSWRPVPQVVTKADYQFQSTGARTGVNQLNVLFGWLF
jgi:hypothetical protein